MTAAVHMLPQLVLLIFVLHTSKRCWSQLPMPRLSQIIWKTSLLCLTALRGAAAPELLPVEQNRWRLDASRCATSIAHLPVSVRSAEGKEAKSSQGWASSTKRCHHLQQGRRGERAARQEVPPGGGGVVTPPHRTTRSARAAALLLCKRRRADSRASERLTARSIPSAAAAQAGGEGGAASCVDGVRGWREKGEIWPSK